MIKIIRTLIEKTVSNFHNFKKPVTGTVNNEKTYREKPVINIIDEEDSSNVLSSKSRDFSFHYVLPGLPYSGEGFAHNVEGQYDVADFLIRQLNLKERGPLLDVGYGSNIHIANRFADSGIGSFAVDLNTGGSSVPGNLWTSPVYIGKNENGVNLYRGDISDLSNDNSELKNNKFGLILFNGSWSSGGNNFTAFEMMDGKYHNLDENEKTFVEFMEDEKHKILKASKEHLTENGLFGVCSSRYAFHGEGVSFGYIPDEKLHFVELYYDLVRLGAKEIYLVGMSQDGFDKVFERSKENPVNDLESYKTSVERFGIFELSETDIDGVREQLRSVDNLPRSDCYSESPIHTGGEYRRQYLLEIIEATKDVPELNQLARIDALFARF